MDLIIGMWIFLLFCSALVSVVTYIIRSRPPKYRLNFNQLKEQYLTRCHIDAENKKNSISCPTGTKQRNPSQETLDMIRRQAQECIYNREAQYKVDMNECQLTAQIAAQNTVQQSIIRTPWLNGWSTPIYGVTIVYSLFLGLWLLYKYMYPQKQQFV